MTFIALGMAIGWFVHLLEQQQSPTQATPKTAPKPHQEQSYYDDIEIDPTYMD